MAGGGWQDRDLAAEDRAAANTVATIKTTADLADLLRRLVDDDPIERSMEGLDDGCHWCGADPGYLHGANLTAADRADHIEYRCHHRADCPWVEARLRLGMPLREGSSDHATS